MKVAHWVIGNNSGMNRVAESIQKAERVLGLDSVLINLDQKETFSQADDADIHVAHTHLDDKALYSGKPLIWVTHGTPEVMFHSSYEQGTVNGSYGHGDAWMLAQFWLQHCDTIVTFLPRHQAIWKSLSDKRTRVELVPMGIELDYWKPVTSLGKYVGKPSIFSAENCYEIKWPLDLFIAWPWVVVHPELHLARIHVIYLPKDQWRWWFPLVNRNGTSFHAYLSGIVFNNDQLRNAFVSTDYYIGLARYGDRNRICLEATACGSKLISYRGNPYASYWITEGDQRVIAEELISILTGKTEPRANVEKPIDVIETAKAMKEIYEKL